MFKISTIFIFFFFFIKSRFATGSFYLLHRRIIKFNEYGFTVIEKLNSELEEMEDPIFL